MIFQSISIGLYRALCPQVIHGKGIATMPLLAVSKGGGSAHQTRGKVLDCGRVVCSYPDYIKRVVWKQY